MWAANSSGGSGGGGVLLAGLMVVAVFGLLGWIVSSIAVKKGRSRVGWFILGACFFVPALIGALLLKPNHDHELRSWVAGGGALCEECREPLNFGASRCRHCGAQQSRRAPEAGAVRAGSQWGPPEDNSQARESVAAERAAIRFFDDELAGDPEANLTGVVLLDVRALLGPIGSSARLATERAQTRCQGFVDRAMLSAGAAAGWVPIDDVIVPVSWAQSYRVLADLDDGPALLAFIERSRVAPGADGMGGAGPGRPAGGSTEVVYDLRGWTFQQVAAVTAALDARNAWWELEGDELVVGTADEEAVDALVTVITGEGPESDPAARVPLPPLPPPPPPPPPPPQLR